MNEIIQFDNLAQLGILKDIPDLTLPQNGYSDAVNVRFQNNSIKKIKGEVDLGDFGNGTNEIIFVAYWANPNLTPNNGYYVYVYTDSVNDYVCLRSVTGTQVNVLYSEPTGGKWQSTNFQGGYILILNNGINIPRYISDVDGNTDILDIEAYQLTGWNDAYQTLEEALNLTYNSDTSSRDFSLGKEVDLSVTNVLAYILDDEGAIKHRSELFDLGTEGEFTLSFDTETNTHIITASAQLISGYKIVLYVQSLDKVSLSAGVIRSFGNLLIAGDLKEVSTATGKTVRRLTGGVRTSDVAPPGAIPTNWNPFAAGVSTADEFILSATGIVQDIVELQGRAYVYTNDSIHSITPTNNVNIPFSLNVVSSAYGCHSINSVIEVDGRHIVVGSNDIYIFSGHPGNIESISDNKIRYYFYDRLNNEFGYKLKVLRYQKYNEIWFCFPNTDSIDGKINETLIWNYRTNVFTRRVMSDFDDITVGLVEVEGSVDANQAFPIIASGDTLIAADISYTDKNGNSYESFFERTNLDIRPMFGTEYISGIGLYAQSSLPITLALKVNQKNNPSDATDFNNDPEYYFYSNTLNETGESISDYKTDIRINGRFMGYKISDKNATSDWTLSGMMVNTGKAGRR